jgi:hypothetical protein
MPKLMRNGADDGAMTSGRIPGLNGYGFSGVRTDRLGASHYTLVTVACDVSGSVAGFRDSLVDTLKRILSACRKSPKASNLMVRTLLFNHSVTELHGFKSLDEIDDGDYDGIDAGGGTALHDACASAIGAMTEYGRLLVRQDYGVDGMLFVVTDGRDEGSTYSPSMVLSKASEAVSGEVLESFSSVLVGINAGACSAYLDAFGKAAGLTRYVDAGSATPGNLARLADFVSRSVSSGSVSGSVSSSASVTI